MDEIDRLRLRGAGFIPPDHDRAVGGTPRFLGQVVSTGDNLGVGKFLLVNPSEALGAEVEGGPGAKVVDTTRTVPVYLAGPGVPATGDFLVCRFVDHRWVATKRGGSTPPGGIGSPGCICITPASLSITVTFAADQTAATYHNTYKSGSLAYHASAPGYMPQGVFPGAGWYSTEPWTDDFGFLTYYRLVCFASAQWYLGVGTYGFGFWQSPGQVYGWVIGPYRCTNNQGQIVPCRCMDDLGITYDCPTDVWNTCADSANPGAPFYLWRGHVSQGVIFRGKFVVQAG